MRGPYVIEHNDESQMWEIVRDGRFQAETETREQAIAGAHQLAQEKLRNLGERISVVVT